MVKFDEPFKNVVSFQLVATQLPQVSNVIRNNNIIKYIIDDEEKIIEVTSGTYNSITLLNKIKDLLNPEFSLTMNEHGNITIKNEYNKIFDIINNDKSVLRQLGFTKLNYMSKKEYTSDDSPSIDKTYKINLFIEGIDDDKPLAVFNSAAPHLTQPTKVIFDKPVEIEELFIKFKYAGSDQLIDFHEESHEIVVRVGTI